jgi:glutathione S-transferase
VLTALWLTRGAGDWNAVPATEFENGPLKRSKRGAKMRDESQSGAIKPPLLDATVRVAVDAEVETACDVMNRHAGLNNKEALVGVEPTMADLQSAALATWLQRLKCLLLVSLRC